METKYWQVRRKLTQLNQEGRSNNQTLNAKNKQNTLFLSACGTFRKVGHVLNSKVNPPRVQERELAQTVFSDHNAIVEINIKNKMIFSPRNFKTFKILYWATLGSKLKFNRKLKNFYKIIIMKV